uniref:haloalkane dehalogenase n=1 Tax=uncultured Draconibacterium sp. TaxID=1573823 RepID=UPI003216FE60
MKGQSKNSAEVENSLPDYLFHANFIEIDDVNLHYIDEGSKTAPVILFLHGVPTWSFTFRKIFPECLAAGYRIVAPDLPGFGRSDKPGDPDFYSISNLVEVVGKFIQQKKLQRVFLFAHDWGAIIGMVLAAKHPACFSGIIVCNGYLPDLNVAIPPAFRSWRLFCKYSPVLPVGRIIDFASNRKLLPAERKAYDFPFKTSKDKIAVRTLPQLIPVIKSSRDGDLVDECWRKLEQLEQPFLTVFSNRDKITRGGEILLQQRIPGAKNQAHKILNGRHFLQEDALAELGVIITEFVKKYR